MSERGPERFSAVLRMVEEAIGSVCSCAVVQVRQAGAIVCEGAFGESSPGGPIAMLDALFDLASLTKIAVTTAMLVLLDRRTFALDDSILETFPRFAGRDPRRKAVTYRHLLSHTSGLPPSVNARAEVDAAHVIERACATPLVHAPGEVVVYSDCGFILLGEAVARLSGLALPLALQSMVFDPLAISTCGYRPQGELLARVVCTERDAWRGRLLCGEVHDETCWSMGGVAGHAGLFGTVHDVARLAEMYREVGQAAGRPMLLRPTALAAIREQAAGNGERRGLGWALKPADARPWGHKLSAESFGHTGYTGTSVFVDPARELTVVLLTNRVYLSREPGPIADLRVALHDEVVACATSEAA